MARKLYLWPEKLYLWPEIGTRRGLNRPPGEGLKM